MFPCPADCHLSKLLIPTAAKEEVLKITAYIDENHSAFPAVALNEAPGSFAAWGA